MAALAGAASLDDTLDELLRQAAHDLLAAAVMKRRDIGKLEAGAAEMPGLLDQTGTGAAAGGGYGRDRPGGAAADHDDVEIGLLRCHFHFLSVPMEFQATGRILIVASRFSLQWKFAQAKRHRRELRLCDRPGLLTAVPALPRSASPATLQPIVAASKLSVRPLAREGLDHANCNVADDRRAAWHDSSCGATGERDKSHGNGWRDPVNRHGPYDHRGQKGLSAKGRVERQLQLFDTSPAALQGVVAERADITNNTEPPQLAARARGGKIVQVMTGYLSGKQNGLVVDGELIKKPADLIGKSVGVQRGSGANYHLAWFLQHNDIPVDKVSIKYLDAPDQIPAMAREDIQAFFSWEPFLTKAVETVPKAKIFSRTIDDGFVFAGNVAMREDMAKNHKDVAVNVVKGLIAAADWMTANPMEAAKAANEVLHAPSLEQLSKQIQYLDWPGTFTKKVYDQELRIAEWSAASGLIPIKDAKSLVGELVYPAIIKEAAPKRSDL